MDSVGAIHYFLTKVKPNFNKLLQEARNNKLFSKAIDAKVIINSNNDELRKAWSLLRKEEVIEILGVSDIELNHLEGDDYDSIAIEVNKIEEGKGYFKCPRCFKWHRFEFNHDLLCDKCCRAIIDLAKTNDTWKDTAIKIKESFKVQIHKFLKIKEG